MRTGQWISKFGLMAALVSPISAGAAIEVAPLLGATSFKIENSDLGSRAGGLFGIEVMLPTEVQGLKFNTGLSVLETGAKNDYFFASTEIAITSLAVPALAQWDFYDNQDSGRKVYLRGGLVLTQVVSAKAKASLFGESAESDIKGDLAQNDLMGIVGIGGSVKVFDEMRVSLDAAWAQGTSDTVKAQSGKSSGLLLSTSLIVPL